MFRIFKSKEETVSRVEYDAKLSMIAALESDVLTYQRRIGRLEATNADLVDRLIIYRKDAEKYRRSVANLYAANARRKAQSRDKQQAEVGA